MKSPRRGYAKANPRLGYRCAYGDVTDRDAGEAIKRDDVARAKKHVVHQR